MELDQLADLHNRRDNIAQVAREAQTHLYPLLVWPEDKALLRLTDLPIIYRTPNIPQAWSNVRHLETRGFCTDQCLRNWITAGRAYFRSFVHHSGLTMVAEYSVSTYATVKLPFTAKLIAR